MRPASIVATAVAAIAVLVIGVWQWQAYREREQAREEVASAAEEYLGRLGELAFEDLPPLTTAADTDVAAYHADAFSRIQAIAADYTVEDVELSDEGTAEADFSATLGLAGLGEWEHEGTLPMVEQDGAWLVEWSPSALHPDLGEARLLTRERSWPERAPITDRDGDPIDVEATSLSIVIGTVGEASEERAAELGHPYLPDDPVGTTGLQAAYEQQLAGTPSGRVLVVDEATGEPIEVLEEFEGGQGAPLRTTIDPRVQAAAEAALPGSVSSLVAIDPATGDLLAVANQPAGDNRAMNSRYAPGSTFKVVTTAAILRSGVEPDTPVSCPRTTTVTGWEFGNFEDMALGTIPFRRAVYESCNTAFVQLTADLSDEEVVAAAEDFGFNTDYPIAIPHRAGSFPTPESATERAAAGFGQAKVETSPMHMASVAAAVSDGTWRPPRLVLDEPEGAETTEGAEEDAPDTADDAEEDLTRDVSDVAGTLRAFMNDVVVRGTAEDAPLPHDTFGKTGTAEFGSAPEGEDLPTNAWYIGFAPWEGMASQDTETTEQSAGDEDGEGEEAEEDQAPPEIAFGVIVEGGESGGEVAAPVAARFLGQLRR